MSNLDRHILNVPLETREKRKRLRSGAVSDIYKLLNESKCKHMVSLRYSRSDLKMGMIPRGKELHKFKRHDE